MRVLVVTSLYPPHALGGYEMSCRDVVDRWRERGHDVHVLTTDTRLPGVDDVAEPQVDRTLRWYWRDHRIVRPSWRERLDIERHNRSVLTRALAAQRPDVVSVWSMGAMSLGLVDVLNTSGVPAAYVICDEWPVYGPRLDGWLSGFTGRGRRLGPVARALTGLPTVLPEPRAATFCWLSDYVRAADLAATGWTPRHETLTYTGIDPADFPLQRPRAEDWRWRLLAVGRVEPRKGFAVAIDALAELPAEATLRIVGPDDGSHRAALHQRAADLGVADRVRFDGVVPRAQLHAVYRDADALLFPSAWAEPFGLVPVEAMANATPVVAMPTGGAGEYLADEHNCLTATDAASLAAAVRRLATDPPLRARLVAGGLATAADLSVDRLADVLEDWHRAAADRYAGGEPAPRPAPTSVPAR
ncbi:MAG TPA: glycosyltransferase family 4 protein [Mycobacteriales bacterium]|nr:glycosyltransferase family 4 protein [Mycobacteriales bacterium]